MSTLDEDGSAAFRPRPDWLGLRQEEILDPDLAIIDPHQHMWEYGARYFLDESWADARSGHNVIATCHIQCGAMYSADAPPLLAPVGETEFANGIAARSASGAFGDFRACAGIIGFADLTQGAAAGGVLDAHMRASPRFRGVRHLAIWDADSAAGSVAAYPPGLLLDKDFRAGVAELESRDLIFETWVFHPQLGELADLARAIPRLRIVLDHIGTPLGVGSYANRREEVLADWRRGLGELAACPNVHIKLSGLAMHHTGFGLEDRAIPASSEELAGLWQPCIASCIDAFGPQRAMFASNFPVEKLACPFPVLWNAFKRLAAGCSEQERRQLFCENARSLYRLELPSRE